MSTNECSFHAYKGKSCPLCAAEGIATRADKDAKRTKKFTAGTWLVGHYDDELAIVTETKTIALLEQGQYTDTEIDTKEYTANARLIAAAPDMYELLEEVLTEQESHQNYDSELVTKIKTIFNKIG